MAQTHVRSQWNEMEPSNPHRAAHFGSYAFKPTSVLNSIDEGINSVTGNVLRLEGHVQNDITFSEASQSLLISKFGKLRPSLLFQFLIPLFLIFLSFSSYTAEYESGRLKLLINQGASISQIALAKVLSVWTMGLTLLLLTTITQLCFNTHHFTGEVFVRLTLLMSAYGIYYFTIISMTVAISLLLTNATASMSLMIIIWISWTIFFPKIIGNAVEQLVPLPTRINSRYPMTETRV